MSLCYWLFAPVPLVTIDFGLGLNADIQGPDANDRSESGLDNPAQCHEQAPAGTAPTARDIFPAGTPCATLEPTRRDAPKDEQGDETWPKPSTSP